jgi:toxin YoeB
MNILWTPNTWDDYLYWQNAEKKILTKINKFIDAIKRSPFEGIGKPEPLKFEFAGKWSRRIDSEHRLIYEVSTQQTNQKNKIEQTVLVIFACRYHY